MTGIDWDARAERIFDDTRRDQEAEFWDSRETLRTLHDFARSRRVGPCALFGSVMVRLIANIPPNVVIPAIIGGPVSLNPFVGLVSNSGGGKGSSEAAAVDAIMVPEVTTMGPGSGE